jgi:hypothetical protein
MKELQTLNLKGKIKLLSPLIHSEEQTGYSTKFRRINFDVNGEYMPVPVLSGNSIRGVLRRLGANHLLEKIELASDDIPDGSYYCLYSGGILTKGKKTASEPDFKRQVRQINPFLSLFGSTMRQQMLSGKLQVGMGIPIAQETAQYTGIESERRLFDMLQEITYTRRDDRETKEEKTIESENKHQMLMTVETLLPGVELYHGFTLRRVNEFELACFYAILKEFEKHPYLGGAIRIGHGKVEWDYQPGNSKPYEDFLARNKKKIKQHLVELEF